ncbi:WhiB family transcriptional regulator [Streptomyces sp. NPDC000410]|uniref:WhiB family transcriptional regulator n=1 Tax=Streptomyces sp. NPDC000410 TaxID=3154254 RepID=UPI0033336F13
MKTHPAEGAVAACRDADPALFFQDRPGPAHDEKVLAAKRLCHGCPMRRSCLAQAVRRAESEGIWGGFTTPERRRLREHAARMRLLDPGLVADLQAGRRIQVPASLRPALVHRLHGLGWSEVRIAEALGVAPFAVRAAGLLAADATLYARAEDEAASPAGARAAA